MVIRCERCSTMYELDESLLSPGGSPVQCTRCQHVFTAFPPRSAGGTLAGTPAQGAAPERKAEPPGAPSRGAAARAHAGTGPVPPAREAPAPRPVRTAPAPVYRPPSSSPPTPVGRAPVLKRDTVGTFEARLRWSARWRWLAPALAAGIPAAVAAVWLLLSWTGEPAPPRGQAEALALLARDDGASLDEAAAKLAEAPAPGRKPGPAAADRALVLVLRAAGLAEERDAIAAQLAARAEERDRLLASGATPPDDGNASAVLEREVRARDERVRALSTAAAAEIRTVQAALGDTPEVRRAAASLHALRGEREQVQKLLRSGEGRRDPWLDLADGWLDARDPDRARRARAREKLGALAAARPDILRGRYLLACAEASLGRRAEALAAVEGVLAANRRHEGARRLREELTAQQAVASPAAPAAPAVTAPDPALAAPPTAPRAEKAPPQRRKTLPQPTPGASPPPPAATPEAPPDGTPSAPAPAAPAAAGDPPAPSRPAGPGPAVVPPPSGAPPRSAESAPAERPPAPPRPATPPDEPEADPGSQGG